MTTLSDIISVLQNELDPEIKMTDFKNSPLVKHLSKYLQGGISKLKKDEVANLVKSIMSYKKDDYVFNGNKITPDFEQQAIIDAPTNCNIRVVAGAGTGKTTTIMCRVKKLLDIDTTPDRILVLTEIFH